MKVFKEDQRESLEKYETDGRENKGMRHSEREVETEMFSQEQRLELGTEKLRLIFQVSVSAEW